jgi:hypothetical protein
MEEYKGVCILTHISGDAHFYGLGEEASRLGFTLKR